MRIAIVGLGSIAQRAYLPTLRRLSDVELILCRRDRARLERLATQYRISEYTSDVAELASINGTRPATRRIHVLAECTLQRSAFAPSLRLRSAKED